MSTLLKTVIVSLFIVALTGSQVNAQHNHHRKVAVDTASAVAQQDPSQAFTPAASPETPSKGAAFLGLGLFGLFLLWFIPCFIPAFIASSKGRSFLGFFLISFFFTPLIGLIAALVAGRNQNIVVAPTITNVMNQPAHQNDVATLERLSTLRSQGAVTEAEF